MEVTVIYKGSELLLEGDYIQAYSGRDEEPISDYFETCCVFAGGVEITELLNDDQMMALDQEAIDALD
jgi:hypothetical protein